MTDDIRLDSWEKYALMGTNSALFCRYDGPAGKVRKLENYRELAGEAVGEVIAAAKAYGVTFPENYKKDYLALFDSLPEDTITSLYRDLKDGKKVEDTETEMILGRMVEMGKKKGVETPCFKEAWERARGIRR